MNETKLKPCPFCGGEAEIDWANVWSPHNKTERAYFAICTVCEKMGEVVYDPMLSDGEMKRMAENEWNRRATDAKAD